MIQLTNSCKGMLEGKPCLEDFASSSIIFYIKVKKFNLFDLLTVHNLTHQASQKEADDNYFVIKFQSNRLCEKISMKQKGADLYTIT